MQAQLTTTQTQLIGGTAFAGHPHSNNATTDDDILLNSKQVRALVGNVTDMCIWRWRRDDRVKFPEPAQINKRNYWRLGDLRRWQAAQTEKKAA